MCGELSISIKEKKNEMKWNKCQLKWWKWIKNQQSNIEPYTEKKSHAAFLLTYLPKPMIFVCFPMGKKNFLMMRNVFQDTPTHHNQMKMKYKPFYHVYHDHLFHLFVRVHPQVRVNQYRPIFLFFWWQNINFSTSSTTTTNNTTKTL